MRIGLLWSRRRHQCSVNQLVCGQLLFEDMAFSADRSGVILGWNQRTGACWQCLGDAAAQRVSVSAPRRRAVLEVVVTVIEFMQCLTLCFVAPSISSGDGQGAVSGRSMPQRALLMAANALHFRAPSAVFPVEWMVSMSLILLFMMLFTSSTTFGELGDRGVALHGAMSVLNVVTMRIGFIPMLGAMLRLFECTECWPDGVYWLCVVLSVPVLAVFLPTACRLSARSFDLEQIDASNRWKWTMDAPRTDFVHLASTRSNTVPLAQRMLVIVMVAAATVFVRSASLMAAVLAASAAMLCAVLLFEPPFYGQCLNILVGALSFGVLWTDLWCLFVIEEDVAVNVNGHGLGGIDYAEIGDIETGVHLGLLVPAMTVGALSMWTRTHRNVYDEGRGAFRRSLHSRGSGLVAEDMDDLFAADNLDAVYSPKRGSIDHDDGGPDGIDIDVDAVSLPLPLDPLTLSPLPRGDSVKRPISESSARSGTVNTFYSDIQNVDEISNRSETKSVVALPSVSQIGFSYNGQDLRGLATKRRHGMPMGRIPPQSAAHRPPTAQRLQSQCTLDILKRSKTTNTATASTELIPPEPTEYAAADWTDNDDANKLVAIQEAAENHTESDHDADSDSDDNRTSTRSLITPPRNRKAD